MKEPCGLGAAEASAWRYSLPLHLHLPSFLRWAVPQCFCSALRATAAQPRALFGGHLGGALIGTACYQFFGDALWVYVLAQVLVLWYMLLTGTVHPNGRCQPHHHDLRPRQLSALWHPVFVGVLSLAVVAVVWSRMYPDLSPYPVAWLDRSPPSLFWGGGKE